MDGTIATIVVDPKAEGTPKSYYVTKYERSPRNRDIVIALFKRKHGHLYCEVCGFDFEATYGELGRDFIEVHHNKPLYSLKEETIPNPETDFNCLCSNCHRMLHRRMGKVLTVSQLKKLIQK